MDDILRKFEKIAVDMPIRITQKRAYKTHNLVELMPSIITLQEKGYSLYQIRELLQTEGFTVSYSLLKNTVKKQLSRMCELNESKIVDSNKNNSPNAQSITSDEQSIHTQEQVDTFIMTKIDIINEYGKYLPESLRLELSNIDESSMVFIDIGSDSSNHDEFMVALENEVRKIVSQCNP